MGWEQWLSVAALVVSLCALTVVLADRRGRSRVLTTLRRVVAATDDVAGAVLEDMGTPQVAFVVNPTKPEAADLREKAMQLCAAHYLPQPLFFETTEADPGAGQARQALAAGAQVVVACGGDGTVRAVAGVLASSGAVMGLLPLGTANLLARNLDLPLTDVDQALRVALSGRTQRIDVGWLGIPGASTDDPAMEGTESIFLVIGGLGFDAQMIGDTDPQLKRRVGWIAYFVSGFKHLNGRRFRARMTVDGQRTAPIRLRTLLVGNCGKLPAGLTLLPDAVLDDGWLDVAAVDTRGGLVGWAQLLWEVIWQGFGLRPVHVVRVGRIDHLRGRRIEVEADEPQRVQVDGDVVGTASSIVARVDPGALVVRVPR